MFRRNKSSPSRPRVHLDTVWWGETRSTKAAAPLFAAAESVWPLVLLGLLMFLIFYLPNLAQFGIETGIRGINPANILFVLILFVFMAVGHPPSEPTPLKLPILLFLGVLTWALLVALAGDASAWVEDVTVWKNGVFYILLYFLYFAAVRDLRTVRILLLVLLFVLLTSAVLGVRQAIDYGIGSFNEQKRVAAPFGWGVYDANRSAVFFCIHLQLALAVMLFLKSRGWLRLACALIVALGIFSIFHTYSRQAYFIIALLIFLIAVRKHFLYALLAGVLLFHYELWVPETVVQRIEMTSVDPFEFKTYKAQPIPTFDSLSVNQGALYGQVDGLSYQDPFRPATSQTESETDADKQYDDSTESRFTLWAGAWELIVTRPVGIGLNRFKREITPYVPHTLAGKDAHNFFVLLATEAGFIAPLFLLALIGGLLVLGWRLSRIPDDEESRTLGIGFMMATLAVVLGNVYGSRFLDGDVMGNYWILAGLVARTLQLKSQAQRERSRTARVAQSRYMSVRPAGKPSFTSRPAQR
jgi:O-antigen ligase